MKNPIGTTNIVIGFDLDVQKDFFRLEDGKHGLTEQKFTELLADPEISSKILVSTAGANLTKFEHSFNLDGDNKSPHFKIKFVDLDDSILKKLLSCYISVNPDAWYPDQAAKGRGLGYKPKGKSWRRMTTSEALIYAGLAEDPLDIILSAEMLGTRGVGLLNTTPDSDPIDDDDNAAFLKDKYGVDVAAEYGGGDLSKGLEAFMSKVRNRNLLKHKLKNNPPLVTKVFVMYGMGSDFRHWVGPFQGVITRIGISYDSNLLQEYEILINSTSLAEGSIDKDFAVTEEVQLGTYAAERFDTVSQPTGSDLNEYEVKYSNTGNPVFEDEGGLVFKGGKYFTSTGLPTVRGGSPLTESITNVLEKYFKKKYNIQNVIVILPDLDYYLQYLLERILHNLSWRSIKWNDQAFDDEFIGLFEVRRDNWSRKVSSKIRSWLPNVHGIDWESQKESELLLGPATEKELQKGVSLFHENWYLTNAYIELLGLLGFRAGEIEKDPNWTDLIGGSSKNTQSRIVQAMRRAAGIEEVSQLERVEQADSLGMFRYGVKGLGAGLQVYGVGASYRAALTIEDTDVESPEKLIESFFSRCNMLMKNYMIPEPFFAFENDSQIIDAWIEGVPGAGGAGSHSYYINPFDLTANESSVLVVGDPVLVATTLYGDAYYVDEVLKSAGVDATEHMESLERLYAAMPLHSYHKTLKDPTFWARLSTIGRSTKSESYFEPKPILPDFSVSGPSYLTGIYDTLREILPEFRAGYPESNILSLEENIDKYLLTNIFKISHSAAIKDFMRGSDVSGPGGYGGGVKPT